MNDQTIDRIEKKYLITKAQKKRLLKFIKRNMNSDAYHKSEVYNLYFDDDDFSMISESIDWVDFKKKIRARSYGGYDRVFLEIKTKIHPPRDTRRIDPDNLSEENLGYKRRVMITHADFDRLISHDASFIDLAKQSLETTNDIQIATEINYLLSHFNIRPRVLIMYDRESYRDDHGLRITFDENLKYRTENLSFIQEKHDKIYFKDNHNIIMEIKAHGVIPLWLVKELSAEQIYPQQFSKIGKVYEIIRKEQNV